MKVGYAFPAALLLALATLAGCSASSELKSGDNKPLTIRPFGDSITFGYGFMDISKCSPGRNVFGAPGWNNVCVPPVNWGGGYRAWLTYMGAANGGLAFQTEGFQIGNSNSQQWSNNQQYHDGYPGWTNTQLQAISNLPSFANITLIHSGTNDVLQALAANPSENPDTIAQTAQGKLFQVIKNIAAANTTTKLHVAKIIPTAGPYKYSNQANEAITKYNTLISSSWYNLTPDIRSRANIVDMSHILAPQTDYYIAGIHPNCYGYAKMACAWARAIQSPTASIPANPCNGIIEQGNIDYVCVRAKDAKAPSSEQIQKLLKGKK